MVEFDNHKGQFCWVRTNLFCQEGICKDCQIYHDEKLCNTCGAHIENWLEMFNERHYHIKGEVK